MPKYLPYIFMDAQWQTLKGECRLWELSAYSQEICKQHGYGQNQVPVLHPPKKAYGPFQVDSHKGPGILCKPWENPLQQDFFCGLGFRFASATSDTSGKSGKGHIEHNCQLAFCDPKPYR